MAGLNLGVVDRGGLNMGMPASMSGLNPQPGLYNGLGGQTAVPPKTKTVYTLGGAAVQVPDTMPTTQWQPNTGYAGTHYFDSPPPPQTQAPTAQPSQGGSSGGGSPSSYLGLNTAAQAEPMVAPTPNSAGSNPISQGAYDQEHAQAAAAAAEAAAQKTLAEAAAAAKRGDMELAARLQAEAEQRRLGYLSTVVNTAQGSTPMVSRGSLATDEAGARSAAFARAKEQAGSTALSSIQALKDVMAGSGKMGSSMEGAGIADVVNGGASMLNDYTRDQLMLDLNRAADISDQNFGAQITQRGQNMGMIPSLMALLSSSGTAY